LHEALFGIHWFSFDAVQFPTSLHVRNLARKGECVTIIFCSEMELSSVLLSLYSDVQFGCLLGYIIAILMILKILLSLSRHDGQYYFEIGHD
jgi:hypothetical protein